MLNTPAGRQRSPRIMDVIRKLKRLNIPFLHWHQSEPPNQYQAFEIYATYCHSPHEIIIVWRSHYLEHRVRIRGTFTDYSVETFGRGTNASYVIGYDSTTTSAAVLFDELVQVGHLPEQLRPKKDPVYIKLFGS